MANHAYIPPTGNFLDVLAQTHEVILTPEWQHRLLQSGGVKRQTYMAQRKDLTEDSIVALKKIKPVAVRIAIVQHQSENLELMEELVIGETRQRVLDELADVEGLSATAMSHLAAATKGASLAAKLAAKPVFTDAQRHRLFATVTEQASISSLHSEPLYSRIAHLRELSVVYISELVLHSTQPLKVMSFVKSSEGRLTVAAVEHAISVLDDLSDQFIDDYNRYDTRTVFQDFRNTVNYLLEVSGISEARLGQLAHVMTNVRDAVLAATNINGHGKDYVAKGLVEVLEMHLEFLNNPDMVELYTALSVNNASDLGCAIRELDSLEDARYHHNTTRERLLRIALANPAATTETTVEAFSRLQQPNQVPFRYVTDCAPLPLAAVESLVNMNYFTISRVVEALMVSEDPQLSLKYVLEVCERPYDRTQLCDGLMLCGATPEMLDMLIDSIPNGTSRWRLEPKAQGVMFSILATRIMNSLGDSDDAWQTFEDLSTTNGDHTLVQMAELAAKVSGHTPATSTE
jgi:hypothetical protein